MAISFDVSRDFLDGILLQQPQIRPEQQQIHASAQVHFLPSSPDGTMHTAVVALALQVEGAQQPFAQAGWRFLFTSDAKVDPKQEAQHQFFQGMMTVGLGKIMTVINSLCMHGNMPLVPFEPGRLVRSARPADGEAPAQQGGAPTA